MNNENNDKSSRQDDKDEIINLKNFFPIVA
jgi:hypothetical protein